MTDTTPMSNERLALIEALADAEHASWAHWMRYLLSKCGDVRAEISPRTVIAKGKLIQQTDVDHWQRQISTPYADLTEREKQSDRDEVAKILPAIDAYARAECRCDPPGSGEEFCRGHCYLRERIAALEGALRACSSYMFDSPFAEGYGEHYVCKIADAALADPAGARASEDARLAAELATLPPGLAALRAVAEAARETVRVEKERVEWCRTGNGGSERVAELWTAKQAAFVALRVAVEALDTTTPADRGKAAT